MLGFMWLDLRLFFGHISEKSQADSDEHRDSGQLAYQTALEACQVEEAQIGQDEEDGAEDSYKCSEEDEEWGQGYFSGVHCCLRFYGVDTKSPHNQGVARALRELLYVLVLQVFWYATQANQAVW